MSSMLDSIYAAKRVELDQRKQAVPLEQIKEMAMKMPVPRDFVGALKHKPLAIIAEIKRASPSKGDILPGLDPIAVARDYADTGAAAISVLTDRHFKGTLDDLRAVRGAVSIPLLRKDFMFDPYQVYEARAADADCILLIAAMLSHDEVRSLAALASELGLATLVEVHNNEEFKFAQGIDTKLIGINNRDLHTFVTDIAVTERLLASYRGDALVVAESGINTAVDIERLYNAGARAFLIGESLLRGGNPRAHLAELLNSRSRTEAHK
ncbi:MAG TPA: indole-3-glycerol phosphate synthase TrpC [Candidatus Binataceae bacterium]|nr:indole-3-glycerol phosphate synthase TrpC [Candidatus Binataceae bacterium]